MTNERLLTTHILDTAAGRPAAGLHITLSRLNGVLPERLLEVCTNEDGRCDEPLLMGSKMVPGRYELVFHYGDYLRRNGIALSEPLFLDDISVRFGISDSIGHYHVPLLVSPFGYSTYRGS
jgi:5-hydroxyisourate hydrolase